MVGDVGLGQSHGLANDNEVENAIGGLVEGGVLVVQIDGCEQQGSGGNSDSQQGFEVVALFVGKDNVQRHTGGVDHWQFVQQLELVPQSHVEHPGAKAHNEEANGRKDDGGVVFFPVDVDDGVQSHDHEHGVGGGVHDFRHVFADHVVFLAPVNGRGCGAPVAVVHGWWVWDSSRKHFVCDDVFVEKGGGRIYLCLAEKRERESELKREERVASVYHF